MSKDIRIKRGLSLRLEGEAEKELVKGSEIQDLRDQTARFSRCCT